MPAAISLANLQPNPSLAGQVFAKLRATSTGQIVIMQEQLLSDVLDPETSPKDRAACARAYQVLEAQKRANQGKANPAPIKSESRKRGRGSIPAVRPVPEPSQDNAAASLDGARVKDARILDPGTVKQNPSEPITVAGVAESTAALIKPVPPT